MQINVDAFHLRVCSEAVGSLTASLQPLLDAAAEDSDEVSVSRRSSADAIAMAEPSNSPALARVRKSSEQVVSDQPDGKAPAAAPSVPVPAVMSPTISTRDSSAPSAAALLAAADEQPQHLLAALVFKDISVLLVSSLSHSPTPVARLCVRDLSAADSSSEGAQARLELALQLDHFNWRIAQWEPIVESCSIVLEMIQRAGVCPRERAARSAYADGEAIGARPLDDAINALHGATFRIEEAFSAPLHVLVNGRTKPPYAIRNETGVALRYSRLEDDPRGENAEEIAAGMELPLLLWQQGGSPSTCTAST